MNIDQILDRIYPLPDLSKQTIRQYIREIQFLKGKVLLRANRVEKSLYFINKGIVRAYANPGDKEITFWFGKEGDTIISMKSYVANEEGYEDMETLESCELYELKIEDLRKLFTEDIHIANWGRRFAEYELVRTERRLISRQFQSATERYRELLDDHPDLIQRVQLRHIASYLGITQVSLSRIRAEVKQAFIFYPM